MNAVIKGLVTSTIMFVLGSTNAIAGSVEQREVEAQNLVYMKTSEGMVIYELLPQVAPNHAQRFRDLVKEGFYDKLGFYRVIDGFVAQAGEGEKTVTGSEASEIGFKLPVKAEFTRALSEDFNLVQSPDLFAPETGFIDSVPAGRDPATKEEWLLHCPGTLAMARDSRADSATTEFYITIGQSPRQLDRNMSIFARVVSGMEVVQRMKRGDKSQGGVISDPNERTTIEWAKMGSDVDAEFKKQVLVNNFDSKRFQQRLTAARKRPNPFYVYPGNGNIDVCYYQPEVSVN